MKKYYLKNFLFVFALCKVLNAQEKVNLNYTLDVLPLNNLVVEKNSSTQITLSKSNLSISNQDDFSLLEDFYLSNLNYNIDNNTNYNSIVKNYNINFSSFNEVNLPKNYLIKSLDTIKYYNESWGDYLPSLINNQYYTKDIVVNFDEDLNEYEEEVVNLQNIKDIIYGIDFYENWEIDKNGKFYKYVDGWSINVPFYVYGDIQGIISLPIAFPNNSNIGSVEKFKTFEYEVLFGLDTDKDVSSKITSPSKHNYIYPNESYKFLNLLVSGINDGNIQIYYIDKFNSDGNPLIVKTEEEKKIITSYISENVPEFDEFGDFVYDENGDQIFTNYSNNYNSKDIVGFRFIEDWIIDEKKSVFQKKVRYYAPIVFNKVEGATVGYKPLFWIKAN